MKKLMLVLLSWSVVFVLDAQTSGDALRYAHFDVAGTARTIGVGGGIGALGADYSVVSTNPAGLAMYRTSEFVFSPSLFISSTESELEDGGTGPFRDNKTRFNISNVGYITSAKPNTSSGSKWSTFNIALGMNQIANFNRTFFYDGKTTGSYNDRFLELAFDENGVPINPDNLDQFEAGLAFSTGSIYDPDGNYENGIQWINDFQQIRDIEVYKEQEVRTKGAINELNFSFAGNYAERLMIGVSVGLPFVNFTEEKIYYEDDPDDEIPAFVQTTFREDLTTSGVGVNLKLGLIYRVNQALRIGAAVHTPTSYNLTDNFSTELNYIFDQGFDPQSFTSESPSGAFDYKLKTPWRYIGSAGFIINKKGFLTAELEYVNYGGSKFNFTANSSDPGDAAYQEEVNTDIEAAFTDAINIKLGGEYAVKKMRFRAGYGIYGTPYAEDSNTNTVVSFGLGFRERKFYTDLAFKRLITEETYTPYTMSDPTSQQIVNNSTNNDRIVLTLGFKF